MGIPEPVDYLPDMSEPDFNEVKSEQERRLLHSFGYWDLVALGAVLGAALGFLFGLGDQERRHAIEVFAGMGAGAICAFSIGWVRANTRARSLFFAGWAASRGWTYSATGAPFEDTPLLSSGDRRKASDFFSGFWPLPGSVLYQHRRIVGSGRSEQVTTYVVLHLVLEHPAVASLQIWPRSLGTDLSERIFGRHELTGTPLELESAELAQDFRISYVSEPGADIRTLFTPSAIVKLLDFQHRLPGARVYFEAQGTGAALAIERALSPEHPDEITQLLELWKPIADWLSEGDRARSEASS